jgi:acetyl-CoA C-acetyltransferase
MARRVAIVGVGQTKHGHRNDLSQLELVSDAVRAALKNSELKAKDIDAVICGNMEFLDGNYLSDMWLGGGIGSYLKSGVRVSGGGTTGGKVFETAAKYVGSGLYDTVVAVSYSKLREGPMQWAIKMINEDHFCDVGRGAGIAWAVIQRIAEDLMERNSVTEDHIAKLRVWQAENGIRNPFSHLKRAYTLDEVKNSPVLAWPIRVLHMPPVSDGAGAVVITSEEKAKKICKNPAWVADTVSVHGGAYSFALGNVAYNAKDPKTGLPFCWGVQQAGLKIYKRNGITNPAEELDVIEMYAPSPWVEVKYCENLLVCKPGEGWKMIETGQTSFTGSLPVNPSGGVMCYHPLGASGMLRICEAAIQVKGEGGARQVPDVRTALAISEGGDNFGVATLLKKSL